MKKIIFTGILSLIMVLGACGTDYEETVQEVEEANEQAGIGATSEEEQTDEVAEKEKHDKAAAEKEQAEKEKAEAERVAKEEQEKEEKLAAEKAAEEKAAKEKAAKEKAEAEKVAKENEAADLEQVHLSIMQEHMNMYVDITFDKENKIFKMTPTNEQLISEIEMLPLGIGWTEWQEMVDGIVSMSKTNSDSLGEGYSITLINPLNKENIILWVMDGEVIYNVVDEL